MVTLQQCISYWLLGYICIHKFSKIRVILPITFTWHNGSYAYGKTVTKDIEKV